MLENVYMNMLKIIYHDLEAFKQIVNLNDNQMIGAAFCVENYE
ncbi:16028_t:CDS:1, partial [Funneliformis geosporum]